MVVVNFTNGFGNNLFQYIAARQLAEHHGQEVVALCPTLYYAKSDLEVLGISVVTTMPPIDDIIHVNDANYSHYFTKNALKNNFIVSGYFEDYRYYKNNLDMIKSWFPAVDKRSSTDLVIHYRAGDRLIYRNTFKYKPSAEQYLKAISYFDFENLHIVTDMPSWEYITPEKIREMTFHVAIPENNRIEPECSAEYFNSFVDAFSQYKPIVEKRSIVDDFNFIRSFDNILFEHGTLGWWAAALSDANKVGVYGPWRQSKGKANKNLSQINLEGWFKWN